jgi:hypothetical protein
MAIKVVPIKTTISQRLMPIPGVSHNLRSDVILFRRPRILLMRVTIQSKIIAVFTPFVNEAAMTLKL